MSRSTKAKSTSKALAIPADNARPARDIILSDRTFTVPPLPFRINRAAYPLAMKIQKWGLIDRLIADKGGFELALDEIDDLADLAHLGVAASGAGMPREEFDELPIGLNQLIDAFFVMRIQTGGWRAPDIAA